MKRGDLVKITLQDFIKDPEMASEVVIGTVISVSPEKPQVGLSYQPGPVYNIKILTTDGAVWKSWVDQRDIVEVIEEHIE